MSLHALTHELLTSVSPWVPACLLGATMLAGWTAGWCWGRRYGKAFEPSQKLNDASLALLGLLLGFTFSMSLGKYEQRRQMVISDSNAIGDFYTCAGLLRSPEREQLQKVIRSYAENRLAMTKQTLDRETLESRLAESQQQHEEMQAQVDAAITRGTPVVVPLVNTLNNLTSSHGARLAAFQDRLPPSIILVLGFAAVLSMVMAGTIEGSTGERHAGSTLAFIMLVSLVVWVIVDLNQPGAGSITVSQEPMRRVLEGMGKK